MIAACPRCGARYRIDPSRIGAEGARLRCTQCAAVFRARPPAREAPAMAPTTSAQVAPPVAAAPAPPPPAAENEPPPPEPERERLVLVADPNKESCQATARALRGLGLEPAVAHDGVEAILAIQRKLPRAVILAADLPKMYGFQVCELVKRNESLRSTHVVLVGTVNNPDRYRRPPSELYGADAYIEAPDLPEGLLPILQRFGLLVTRGPVGQTRAASPPEAGAQRGEAARRAVEWGAQRAEGERRSIGQAREAGAQRAEGERRSIEPGAQRGEAERPVAAPAPPPELAEEWAKAERLARIIVSDIILYNEDRFAAAIRGGNVVEAMRGEIEEGRGLFEQRVDARVRAQRDFLAEELLRVARARGSNGR